jgi:hypothetical protein
MPRQKVISSGKSENLSWKRSGPDSHSRHPTGVLSGDNAITLASVCELLTTELRSTGGRPARAETTLSRRISMTEKEAKALQTITALVRERGVGATPSQVAGILLNVAMTNVLASSSVSSPTRISSVTEFQNTVERVLAAAASAKHNLEQLRPVADELLRKMKAGRGVEDDYRE